MRLADTHKRAGIGPAKHGTTLGTLSTHTLGRTIPDNVRSRGPVIRRLYKYP
jgi:hypothetical protein